MTDLLAREMPKAGSPSTSQSDRNLLLERILNQPLLPSPPALALQIVEKVSDPECGINDICRLLACDPALCGKLLKIANSSLYSPSGEVTSIQRAVMLLGLNRLRSLVLGMSIPAMKLNGGNEASLATFWKCSVAGAIIARELAVKLRFPSPEDDLVSALLRDLGMILLLQAFREEYEPVWTGARQFWAGQRCSWEEERFGVDHAEVSAALLRSWRLPDAIVEPIRNHHYPQRLASQSSVILRRAQLLDFASRLAELEDVQQTPDDLQHIWRIARERFSLEPDALKDFLNDISPKIEEFAALLQVKIGNCPRFAEVLSAGCQELARLTVEMADETSPPAGPPREPVAKGGSTAHGGLSTCDLPAPRGVSAQPSLVRPAPAATMHGPANVQDQPKPAGELTRIQNFEMQKEIGRGAMGVVYEAIDVNLGRRVALKVLATERGNTGEARQRFLREARVAAAVQQEHVVTIHSVGEEGGVPFLVMELVSGRSLQEWIDSGRKFGTAEVVKIGQQIALGLAAAHALGIIHRDIKPANILLEKGTDRVRITDFGLARANDSCAITQDGNIVGTPHYMSPEQVDGSDISPAADMFSLGSVLYTLCAGRLPFDSQSIYGTLHMVATVTPTPIRTVNAATPDWLADFIATLQSKTPANRPSAAETARVLSQFSSRLSRQ